MNKGECLKAIDLIKDNLQCKKYKDSFFYVHDKARTRGFRKGKSLLLPSYDEYLISYKSRDLVLPEEFRHRGHNNSGLFYPIIAKDGIICGNWKPFVKSLEVVPFHNCDSLCVEGEWKRYESFRMK